MRNRVLAVVMSCVALIACAKPTDAAWLDWTGANLAVSTATGDQNGQAVVSDGATGFIVAFQDGRSGNAAIFAQHVMADGKLDPQWPVDGQRLCALSSGRSSPCIASDGAGGAILAWLDYRSGGADIYAQRVSANGRLLWADVAIPLSTALGDEGRPAIVPDGAGGAIVAWHGSGAGRDIHAQRVDSTGAVLWQNGGVRAIEDGYSQAFPLLASDGSGGAFVVWLDSRNSGNDIVAQRLGVGGALLWDPSGVVVCNANADQESHVARADGFGGLIVAWTDWRGGSTSDIYAQRLSSAGTALWAGNGVAVSRFSGNQLSPCLEPDGLGGAVLGWVDYRSGQSDIHAQHVSADGLATWRTDGTPVCEAASDQVGVAVTHGLAGATILAWQDYRSGTSDIFAQLLGVSCTSRDFV